MEHKVSKHWDDNAGIGEVLTKLKSERGGPIVDLGEEIEKIITKFPVDHLPDGPSEFNFIEESTRILQLKLDFDKKAQRKAGIDSKDGYKYTSEISSLLNRIVRYLVGKEPTLDSKKGLFIMGVPGCGKTLIMEILSFMLKDGKSRLGGLNYRENNLGFLFKSVTDICAEFGSIEKGREEFFNNYGKRITGWSKDIAWNHLCIDDLGKEEVEKSYQYGHNPIKAILNARYDRRHSGPGELQEMNIYGPITHATSNFGLDTLRKIYGAPLVDRFYQMFNVIKFTSDQSFRQS